MSFKTDKTLRSYDFKIVITSGVNSDTRCSNKINIALPGKCLQRTKVVILKNIKKFPLLVWSNHKLEGNNSDTLKIFKERLGFI